jgi:hypothetical protein
MTAIFQHGGNWLVSHTCIKGVITKIELDLCIVVKKIIQMICFNENYIVEQKPEKLVFSGNQWA